MNGARVLEEAARLAGAGEAFALATVVRVDRPVSAHPGDRALVTPGGGIEGWVGGACAQPVVLREALAALSDGRPRLVRILPPGAAPGPKAPGIVQEVTTCASEGGLEVFIEPHLAPPRLVVCGATPAARTLCELAGIVGYRVIAALDDPSGVLPGAAERVPTSRLAELGLSARDAVVVATAGQGDEDALVAALASGAGYVGLVASRARGRRVLEMVTARGVEGIGRVHTPAGVDLGGGDQREIALSVLAEVVAERHRAEGAGSEPVCGPERAVDPVCGMTVAAVPGTPSLQRDGRTYYFCSPHCLRAFAEGAAGA